MPYLLAASVIWAFSFGLIKGYLAGIDANFIAFTRLFLASLVLLPFLRPRRLPAGLALKMLLVGAIQYGLMYIAYIASFQYLAAFQVAMFTIFTPLYVTLLNDLRQRRFSPLFWFSALLAVLGVAIMVYRHPGGHVLVSGFLLVQVSNLCFALGQIMYRQVMAHAPQVKDRHLFGLLYLGGLLPAALASWNLGRAQIPALGPSQLAVLFYLGVLASGLGFFLWNYGARQTNVGALAVMNNLKIPLAVACSLIFFGEKTDPVRLFLGGTVIVAALFINEIYLEKKKPGGP